MSLTAAAQKRPLEQVGNLTAVPKTHSSVGFRDMQKFKQSAGPPGNAVPQRLSSNGAISKAGIGFLSQRSQSIDTTKGNGPSFKRSTTGASNA